VETHTRYCTSADGTRIAFNVSGGGRGLPWVGVHGWIAANDWWFARADFRALNERTTRGRINVATEWRGVGSSQRDVSDLSMEAQVADLTAVVDALGLPRFALTGSGEGAAVAVTFAARHPERVDRMWLEYAYIHGSARAGASGATLAGLIHSDWSAARRLLALGAFPSGPVEAQREYSRMLRENISPDVAARYFEFAASIDLSELLPRIVAPTTVIARGHPRDLDVVRAVAALIPDASFILLDKAGAVDFPEAWVRYFLEWLGESAESETAGRVRGTVTVLFTDIVGHTEMMQRLGDERGRHVLREHERITRDLLKQHGGSEKRTDGDGFMASFGSVTSAMECAIALQRAFATHSESMPEPLHVRVGLNAGEPIEEDGDLFGSTVILASRIAAQAGAGEILVPDTVRGLLSGKSYVYADRGETILKGFEDALRLYEVKWRE
jgi:class 3 adenylate cyclase